MSLKDQMRADIPSVFLNTEDHAEWREFAVSGPGGMPSVFQARVIWDEETLKETAVAKLGMLYLGDVILYADASDFQVRPRRGEIIYSPRRMPWKIGEVVEAEGLLKLVLQRTDA